MSNARRIMESNEDTVEVLVFALLFIGSVLDVTGISVPFAAAMAMMMYVRILSLARQVDDMYTLLDFVVSKKVPDIDSDEEDEEDDETNRNKEDEVDEEDEVEEEEDDKNKREQDDIEQTPKEEAKEEAHKQQEYPTNDVTIDQVVNTVVESGVVIEEDEQKADEITQESSNEVEVQKEENESSSPVEHNVTSVKSVVDKEVTDMEFIEQTQHIKLTLD